MALINSKSVTLIKEQKMSANFDDVSDVGTKLNTSKIHKNSMKNYSEVNTKLEQISQLSKN